MTKMTIFEALQKLASLNKNGIYALIQDEYRHKDVPTTIEWVIEEIRNTEEIEAEISCLNEESETHDYYVDDSCIREIDEHGRLAYWVVEEME